MATTQLTIYYDSQCPLCLAEMQQLKSFDTDNRIDLVDLHLADFIQRYPHIDPLKAQRILHGELESGQVIKGLDVTCLAWSIVNKHRWLAILRWPLLRYIADGIYLLFARYRHLISRIVMGRTRCNSCQVKHYSNHH